MNQPLSQLLISGEDLLKSSCRKKILKKIREIHEAANLPDALLSLSFVKNKEMKQINEKWRNINKTTDVLSFSSPEAEHDIPGFNRVLGDIVISVTVAKKQAKKLKHSVVDEISVLFAHGLLHTMGLDHEKSPEEAIRQAECEMTLLDCVNVSTKLALSKRGI